MAINSLDSISYKLIFALRNEIMYDTQLNIKYLFKYLILSILGIIGKVTTLTSTDYHRMFHHLANFYSTQFRFNKFLNRTSHVRLSSLFLQVHPNGDISNLDGFKSFPDYAPTAKVFGGKQAMIPEKVTT